MTNRSLILLVALIMITFGIIWLKHTPSGSGDAQSKKNQLIVGTNAEFPPFSFIEDNQITGFDIDVINEVAQRLNKKITLVNMSFEALIPELQVGTINVIAAGMTPTPERAKRVFFTHPHFSGDPLLAIQPKGTTPITHSAQLMGKTVIVNQGYTADHYVTQLGIADIVRLSSPLISTGLLVLNGKQGDVFVAAKSSLQPFLAKQKDNYLISRIAGTAESSALAVSKKYPPLFTAIQSTVSDMLKDGTIATLKKKWGLND